MTANSPDDVDYNEDYNEDYDLPNSRSGLLDRLLDIDKESTRDDLQLICVLPPTFLLVLSLAGLLFSLMGYLATVFAKRRNHRHNFLHIYLASMGCIAHVPFLKTAEVSSADDRLLRRLLCFTVTSAQTSCTYQLLHLVAVRGGMTLARRELSDRVVKINCFAIILVSLGFGTVGALVLDGDFWYEWHFTIVTFVFTFLVPIMIPILMITYSKYRRQKQLLRVPRPTEQRSTETEAIIEEALQNPEQIGTKTTQNPEVAAKAFPEAAVLFFGYILFWAPLKITQLYHQRLQDFHGCNTEADIGLMLACSFSIAMPVLQIVVRSRKLTSKTSSLDLEGNVASNTSTPTPIRTTAL